jgi:hypothetical protein
MCINLPKILTNYQTYFLPLLLLIFSKKYETKFNNVFFSSIVSPLLNYLAVAGILLVPTNGSSANAIYIICVLLKFTWLLTVLGLNPFDKISIP